MAPRPPRLRSPGPSQLRPPKPPKLPSPLRLSPIRSEGSIELDQQPAPKGTSPPPYLRWAEFTAKVRFRQGEHITIVGTTGSGKTVLARELLQLRTYTVVLGTKNKDPELYGPLEKLGYELVDTFDPVPARAESRVIFRPRMTTPDDKGLAKQRAAFEAMLFEVWAVGGWTIYADEIFTLTNRLKLATTFETFWTSGRTEEITLVVATQLPVSIPLLAFDQATHLFLFRNTDKYRIARMAEFTGADSELARYLIPRLPRHEFLYVDTRAGTMLRSKVALR